MFDKTPLWVVLLPINESGNINGMYNDSVIISFHDGPKDYDKLLDVRDYASRITRGVCGSDCGGTFAPLYRIQSTRMALATGAEKGWTVWELHVQTSFLYADVEEDVWAKMIPWYEAKG